MVDWSNKVQHSVLQYQDDEDEEEEDEDATAVAGQEEESVALVSEAMPLKQGRLSLSQAEEMANRASGFYVSPPLCKSLDRVIAQATALENQVTPLGLPGNIYPSQPSR